ncbi:hypothetical protein GLAREA_00679 [Glarea lozoyensis ATCC 20868]|uniref:Uncharacterized protein n=1 Tax=Glarea lozoyensis (strain ATCC 20868 / MF5171) TaxID=1116229 RepID=S3CX60_GLAL2|nr:uncharacterized protein GLAREA_00679 [Glarea lozoyensis ATCC 20868]EPE29519.1 hypothetical protein GLAREA_00679 [Glarea lozoyensis ATCC 20868]
MSPPSRSWKEAYVNSQMSQTSRRRLSQSGNPPPRSRDEQMRGIMSNGRPNPGTLLQRDDHRRGSTSSGRLHQGTLLQRDDDRRGSMSHGRPTQGTLLQRDSANEIRQLTHSHADIRRQAHRTSQNNPVPPLQQHTMAQSQLKYNTLQGQERDRQEQ